MKNDRFLLGILIGIGLLVALSLGLYFLRQEQPAYRDDATPEGVVHNYVTAVQLGDYERAYTYLAEKSDKPTYHSFQEAFLNQLDPENASLQIGLAFITGDEASVEITILRSNNGLFGGTYREQQSAQLTLQDGDWKLFSGPYPYWNWDWYQATLKTP
jgi:hypothetical protein